LVLGLGLVLGLLASAAGPLARGAAAQDDAGLPESAALVPDDALAYVSVDLDISNDQWAQTQELLTRLGYPDALPRLRSEILREAGLANGEVPADDPLFGGEIAVVVTPAIVDTVMAQIEMAEAAMATAERAMATPVAGGATPAAEFEMRPVTGISVIFLPGDADAAWERVQELMAEDNGAETETVDYEGVEIETEPGTGAAIARLDDAIVFGSSQDDVEGIVDVANGDAEPIAGRDDLSDIRGRLANEALIFGYINGEEIGAAVPEEVTEGLLASMPQYAGLGDAIYEFDAGFVLHADDVGFRFDSVQVVPPDSPLIDLTAENSEITADERVAGDTFLFAAGNVPPGSFSGSALSVAQAVNAATGETPDPAMGDPFAAFDPEYVEEQIARAEETLGFNLQTELFDQLGGEFLFASSLPGFAAGGIDFDAIVAVGVEDEAVVAGSVARIARLIDNAGRENPEMAVDVTTREVAGDRVYVLQSDEVPGDFRAELGVVGGELLVGLGQGIDNYLEGPADTLADDPRYQAVVAELPEEKSSVFYLDIAQIVTLLETTGVVGGGAAGGITDADPACGDYDGQEDAQEAYDEDPFANSALDQDFDGEACEDFFAAATPAATPVAGGNLDALQALAGATFRGEEENVTGSSLILYIPEPEAGS